MAMQTASATRAELERQVEGLLAKGFPALAGLDESVFREPVAALELRLAEVATRFAVVVSGVPRDKAIASVELGFTTMESADLERFGPIDGVDVPAGPLYIVADLDPGATTLNVTPDDALKTILAEGRSPLTIDEGLAWLAHDPEILRTANCFSMLGSRCGDRRVTALWISGDRPRLGWCWAGNPHTWLGSASCGARIRP